ncbi:pre-mRNA-splicing factor 8 [Modicella reniformis]|uniref:Pre-mRNA-splicing factor 8 n=1 Tax=Modicella reniformis TaxID=1440133 RepID=A0A9P6SSM1_9FUNG|nr:pre-mRNA-splicing factor 8 [Modicella reniformis]
MATMELAHATGVGSGETGQKTQDMTAAADKAISVMNEIAPLMELLYAAQRGTMWIKMRREKRGRRPFRRMPSPDDPLHRDADPADEDWNEFKVTTNTVIRQPNHKEYEAAYSDEYISRCRSFTFNLGFGTSPNDKLPGVCVSYQILLRKYLLEALHNRLPKVLYRRLFLLLKETKFIQSTKLDWAKVGSQGFAQGYNIRNFLIHGWNLSYLPGLKLQSEACGNAHD